MCFFRVCQSQVWILWRSKENVQKDGRMILSTETQVNYYSVVCLEELEHL